ncbi:polymorphic toxin-type HINT domain-containing protein [Tuwongella immobilis]|uniref:Intein C-terminal splicing domain-containing protein n=1 Tax=Tuwongella immobilis TaxID=692036 RepID=A0A6C2YH70_9BACT|nr:polymorphic toxin-type HINT domain-containing protein [Tuwongella immobilis]VIP00836.1 YD repeat protein OS=Isosphaera pallida (strain ATCC 43644 / DSM 9630 / IS1B) GN=Isop_2419 PE=4 SV=1: PT-HINT [Tuwongella immobilis]VTR97090.1 YD repeat protein OS=Isosphaera pallida (strain ATCC 43644 / DSM 9630 / IS1B) GN=Isop_2419 PE=4 SV=1: PT-HINT [Tuwongella immobilis]
MSDRLIEPAAEHPFWVVGRGWTPVWELSIGDCLTTITGETVSVEGVHETNRRETVYNLRVSDFHTYFVGCDKWGFSVWAHNAEYVIIKDTATGRFHLYEKLPEGGFQKVVPAVGEAPSFPTKAAAEIHVANQAHPVFRNLPPNSMSSAEAEAVLAIAKKYNTTIDVVGSRAAGNGRRIETNLPRGMMLLASRPLGVTSTSRSTALTLMRQKLRVSLRRLEGALEQPRLSASEVTSR